MEAQFGELPQWATEPLSKAERARLKEWESLDLRAMATKRDALPALTSLEISEEKFADLYDGAYAQLSSVAHFDMLSLQFLRTQTADDGSRDLGADDHWPGLLILQNCRFDIIQCFECLMKYYSIDSASAFNSLYILCLSSASTVLPKGPFIAP